MPRPLHYNFVYIRSLPAALVGLFVSGTENNTGVVNNAFNDHLAGAPEVSRGARVRAIIAAGYRNQPLDCYSSLVMLANFKKPENSRRILTSHQGATLPLRTSGIRSGSIRRSWRCCVDVLQNSHISHAEIVLNRKCPTDSCPALQQPV
jgi:hypothetical protein